MISQTGRPGQRIAGSFFSTKKKVSRGRMK
jgi:hypothetical protein